MTMAVDSLALLITIRFCSQLITLTDGVLITEYIQLTRVYRYIVAMSSLLLVSK